MKLRTPGEIMGEFADDEWSGRDWKLVHDAITQAQLEAIEAYQQILDERDAKLAKMHAALLEIEKLSRKNKPSSMLGLIHGQAMEALAGRR